MSAELTADAANSGATALANESEPALPQPGVEPDRTAHARPKRRRLRFVLRALVTLTLSLAIAFVLGPRVTVDETLRAVELPSSLDELDLWLAQREAREPTLRDGTEARIEWAAPTGQPRRKTPYSIVYLHGFTATRQELAPLADIVAEAIGANLYYPRLTAHGVDGEAFATVTVNDWLNDTNEALEIGRMIGERVIVLGTSTGATLAVWLAAERPADVAACVLMSLNLGPSGFGSDLILLPWGQYVPRIVMGTHYTYEPINDAHLAYWTCRSRVEGVPQMMALVDLARRQDLSRLTMPNLWVYTPNDEVVDAARIPPAFEQLGTEAKELFVFEQGKSHVLCGDVLDPDATQPLADHILEFLRAHLLNDANAD